MVGSTTHELTIIDTGGTAMAPALGRQIIRLGDQGGLLSADYSRPDTAPPDTNRLRIGWLKDNPGFIGGSEISWGLLHNAAPDNVELVYCPPNKRPPRDLDAYIIQNCTQYDKRWIEELALRPVIKQVRDPWAVGDHELRRWLLDNSALLIFNSLTHLQWFGFPLGPDVPVELIPPPIEADKFRNAALSPEDRDIENLFVGRVGVTKGVHFAVDYGLRTGQSVEFVGDIVRGNRLDSLPSRFKFHGFVPPQDMPSWYGRAKAFIMRPTWVESFGRVVAEAWYAGCELKVEGRVGALWWIENRPDDIGRGTEMFWDAVREALG
jgi:glycosyltransferase involved in cell wall biosynthesis